MCVCVYKKKKIMIFNLFFYFLIKSKYITWRIRQVENRYLFLDQVWLVAKGFN
jgi:hypothetical protein